MHPGARDVGVELRFMGRDGKRYILQRMHEKPPRSKTTVVMHFTLKVSDDDGERYVLSSDFQDKEEALALKLGEILGLSRRLFDVAVHVKQGEIARMLEGAPELDTVLGVTASVIAADEMRTMALEAEKESAALPVQETALQRLRDDERSGEAREAVLTQSLRDVDAQTTTTTQARADADAGLAALQVLAGLVQTLQEATADVARRHEDLDRQRAALRDDPATLQARRQALQGAIATASAKRQVLDDERGQLERRLGDLEGRIARRAALRDDASSCETCGQPIDHVHAHAELSTWQSEHQQVTTSLAASRAAVAALDDERRRIEADIADHDAALQAWADVAAAEAGIAVPVAALAAAAAAVRAGILDDAGWPDVATVDDGALASTLGAAQQARREALREVQVRSEARLEGLVARRADVDTELQALRERRREGARELARVEAEVERLKERAALATRLRKLSAAFKELQVKLRDQAAADLGAAIFGLHRQLSAPAEEYKALSVDPARYVVQVTPHDIGVEVPAHLSQGGGHKVLLGLAFKLAVARRAGAAPFLLLDEPTYGLDVQRRTALLGRIAALDAQTQMLFITHHEVGDVEGHHIRIVKKGKTSTQERA
jgi:DNA repair exonuclease SbcCD ATPase subunit